MSQKPETVFRVGKVTPFLKTLSFTKFFPIQQLSIKDDPDFLLCTRGKFIALELKIDGEKPRPLQQYKLDEVLKAKGITIVAKPSNWEEVKILLKQLDGGTDDQTKKKSTCKPNVSCCN